MACRAPSQSPRTPKNKSRIYSRGKITRKKKFGKKIEADEKHREASLLNLNIPQPLDSLRLLGPMVVTRMRIDLGDAQCQHGHGQQLKGILQTGAILDLGESRVLRARLSVSGGLEGA